jgi:hypothetical protein
MGDRDVIGGTRTIWEVSGECPKCQEDERRKRYARMIQEVRLKQAPLCCGECTDYDKEIANG